MTGRDIWSFWDEQRRGFERARDPVNIARANREQKNWEALVEREAPRRETILASLAKQVEILSTSYRRVLAYVAFSQATFHGLLAANRYRQRLTEEIRRQTQNQFDILVVCETSYGTDGLYKGGGFLNQFQIIFDTRDQSFSPQDVALLLNNRERTGGSWSMWWGRQKLPARVFTVRGPS